MSRKLALIIGNNNYSTSPLKNCVNDASRLASLLEKLDCDVKLHTNLNSENMYEYIKAFTKTIQPNDFIIFFFAGHGVQWGDQNFLLPCDKDITGGRDMRRYATNAQETVDHMAEKNPHVVVFLLDCCRVYWAPSTARAKAVSQQAGLKQMTAPPGTLIAFACAPGQTTSDISSDADNGIFTKYLLKHIPTPDTDIETVLRRVANDVTTETNHLQRPYRVSSITIDNICLVSNGKYILFQLMKFYFLMNAKMVVKQMLARHMSVEHKSPRIALVCD
jgi:uncharacterized caspase-like protein